MSDVKPILGLGSTLLREICTPIEGTHQGRDVIRELQATLPALPNCEGIAAPQIGYTVRAFIMKAPNRVPYIVINPTIKKRRGKHGLTEGCMSVPDIYQRLNVRDDIIDVEYYDENMNKVTKRLRGFESVVFQHEFDHLNGVLFIDHLTQEGRDSIQEKLLIIQRGEFEAKYAMIFPDADLYKNSHENK